MFFSSPLEANSYKMKNGNWILDVDNTSLSAKTLKELIKHFNKISKLFFINYLLKVDSSMHYSSNLLDSKKDFFKRVEFSSNLFIIDGNQFPGPPSACGNSFSIMTGAYAIVNKTA